MMRIQKAVFILIFLNILFAGKVERIDPGVPPTVAALRIPSGEIQIDGHLDDATWADAIFTSDFVQRDPDEGEDATEKTEFAIAYDDEYLYVAIMAYDSTPSGIRSILSRRDEMTPSDWVAVSVDSYSDYRTAFEFWLNPHGVKRDIRRFDDEMEDLNWDAIWEGKSQVTSKGWSAEFRIPFRELRFDDSASQSWGLQVGRHISRKNEDDFWRFWPKDEGGFVRHYGRLTELVNIPKQRRIYFSPYTTGQYSTADYLQTAVHPDNYNMAQKFGADMKVGISNNLTLDLTINPDFGQVEADPAELNLSAFESYFQEKRPFFVEGGNIFEFGLGFGDGDIGSNSLFYPRRMGQSPHHYPDEDYFEEKYGEEPYTDVPNSSAILAAGKLSGKTSSGLSVGIMEVVTAEEIATIQFENSPTQKEVAEPLTNYFAGRVQKDFRQGKSAIGAIGTWTHRNLTEDYLRESLHKDALTAGIDFRHIFNNDNFQVSGTVAASHVAGTTDAIWATQESSIHYFQRPDADHLQVDTTLTSLIGYAHKLVLEKIGGEHWRGASGVITMSPKFEANDIGFHPGVDRSMGFIWGQYREEEPGKVIRNYRLNINLFTMQTFAGPEETVGRGGNVNANATFLNYWNVGGGLWANVAVLQPIALWGGPALLRDPAQNMWLNLSTDHRKQVSFNFFGFNGSQPEGGVKWSGMNPGVTWRPSNIFSLDVSANYQYMLDTWAAWDDFGPLEDLESPTGEEYYLLATLEQYTVGTTIRFNLTLTPDLTIQYYGSPFVTAGKYSDDKIVIEEHARSRNFDDRFRILGEVESAYDGDQYTYDTDNNGITNFEIWNRDFNYKQFNSNLVIRWEYQTGSTVYLVWSQNMDNDIEDGSFNFASDMKNLFRQEKENVIMLKASYLLNL
ncbi:DUF5916 domain-containing protein [Candidatus Neomarinimicrobiota bacterium]